MNASTHEPSTPIRVGLIYALTGHLSVVERPVYQGAMLAIEELNAAGGINGRPLKPLVADYASDFTLAARQAQDVVHEHAVSVVFGGYTSASRVAMLPVFERADALLFYGTHYEGLECSPNCFYCGAVPNQFLMAYVPWVLDNLGNRVYVIGSDYIYPRTASAIVRKLVIEGGASIVADEYFPLGTTDFTATIADIRAKTPTVVFSNMVGDSTIAFYRQFHEAGFTAASLPIAATVTTEVEIQAMGARYAAGHYMSATYFESLENSSNQRFVRAYRDRWGNDSVANVTVAGAYQSVYLFAAAAERAGNDHLDIGWLRDSLIGVTIHNGPEGLPIEILPNHHCNHPSYVGRANSNGQFEIVVAFEPRDADPFPAEIVPRDRVPSCPTPLVAT